MDFDTQVKSAIYQAIVETTRAPSVAEVAERIGATSPAVGEALRRLHDRHMLVLEPDGETIRMALPFSGVPTPHRVHVAGRAYFANCAWDALGIPAALHRPGVVESRCAWSSEPLRLEVGPDGLSPAADWVAPPWVAPPWVAPTWLAHFAVPAVHWWNDIVYT